MADANDMELAREFAQNHSEAAFTELVQRHIDLVYSVARRFTGNDGDAQDVTQAVFITLARKAATLSEKTLLAGWLYETTRFTASRWMRSNLRRQQREQEAYMRSTLNDADPDKLWSQLEPHLELAMSKLVERDRLLLMLRFYQNKTGAEAAQLLGIRENTAQKRIARALERLRAIFAEQGVASTQSTIAEAISVNALRPAPAALIKTTTAVALAKAATTSTSTLTLIKGALKLMALAKTKTIIATAAIALLATTGTVAVIKIHGQHATRRSLSPSTVNGTYPDPGWTNSPLFMAIYNGDAAKTSALLEAHPEMLNESAGDAGATPVHIAACYGRGTILADLLRRGADINARTAHGHTALHDAIDHSHANCIVVLLEHNADTTLRDDTGRTPYQLAVDGRHVTGLQTLQKYGIAK